MCNTASMFAVPPLEVTIFPAHTGPLSADSASTFHCHAHGSQPPAAVTWFDFQGTKIKDATSEVKIDTIFGEDVYILASCTLLSIPLAGTLFCKTFTNGSFDSKDPLSHP